MDITKHNFELFDHLLTINIDSRIPKIIRTQHVVNN